MAFSDNNNVPMPLVDWSDEWDKTISGVAENPVPIVKVEESAPVPSLVDWSDEWDKTISDVAEKPVPVVKVEESAPVQSLVDWSDEWDKTVSGVILPDVVNKEAPKPMTLSEWSKLWELE